MGPRILAAAVFTLAWFTSAAAQGQPVSIEFKEGLVSVRASNAPVRAILAEWARLGGTRIVNGDRIPGGPVTLELVDIPERQALDVLLREVSGYLVARRDAATPGASSFDRLMILPTSSAPRNAPPPPPAFSPQPTAAQRFPQFMPEPDEAEVADDDFDDDPDAAQRPGRVQLPRVIRDFVPPNGAVGGGPAQPIPVPVIAEPPDQDAAPPAPPPTNPFGVQPGAARPGVITPVPQPPNQRQRPED